MSLINNPAGVKAGTVFKHAGTVALPGTLIVPVALTLLSRVTYAALFAAIGTTWGAGDGVTTFAGPYLEADFAALQANGNVGAASVGAVIAHQHTLWRYSSGTSGTGPGAQASTGNYPSTYQALLGSDPAGGTNNLAAGRRFLLLVKY